ncbi:psbP-like protein 1, chloroplastic [Aristolochia californica]|uniref:psbP-like protein 1, chloroplastic n=1 Tax=Aristolochia californica TaxID=171875 RepID=UPI0035D6A31C
MASVQNPPSIHRTLFLNTLAQTKSQSPLFLPSSRRTTLVLVRAEHSSTASASSLQEKPGRRQTLVAGALVPCISLLNATSVSFAAESKKGFQIVNDRKDGYSFLYPFGWQEVVIGGQDKVFKDVIEPLESVSVNMIGTSKDDIRDLGSPQQVAEALIKRVLAPSSQKTKLVEAKEQDVDGKAYYTFEFVAQAPNFIRHGLGAVTIGNGKFYTLTTGANEKRWGKMKDKLITIVDSFKIFTAEPSAAPPA